MSAVSPPPLNAPPARKSILTPMVLSSLVYPGAGQLMQRRWAAGTLFIVGSTVATGWLVMTVFLILKAYYGLAFDPDHPPKDVPGLAALVIPFVIWLVIYVAGLIDTAIGTYRQQMKASHSLSP